MPVVGDDYFLSRIPAKRLNEEGYINLSEIKDVHPDFAKDINHPKDLYTGGRLRLRKRDTLMHAAVEREKRRLPPDDQEDNPQDWLEDGTPYHIHPALQQTQWDDISNEEWSLIQPSVELASRIIDDPALLPFFAGLEYNVTPLNDPSFVAQHNIAFEGWKFYYPKPAPSGHLTTESVRLFKRMFDLKEFIRWRFKPIPLKLGRFGETEWKVKKRTCIVKLRVDFLELLRGDQTVRDYSTNWIPGPNLDSAILRTRVALAVTIVHEFAHCTWYARNRSFRPDPYLNDRPVNELGYELENTIFSGILVPIGEPQSEAVPYGFKIERFPGISDEDNKAARMFARGTPPEWGNRWATAYAVSMSYINDLFTVEKWDRIARFGLKELRPERLIGVRTYYKDRERSISPNRSAAIRLDSGKRKRHAAVGPHVDASDEEDVGDDDVVIRKDHKIQKVIRRSHVDERYLFSKTPKSALPEASNVDDSSTLFVGNSPKIHSGGLPGRLRPASEDEDTEMLDYDWEALGVGSVGSKVTYPGLNREDRGRRDR